MNGNMNLGKRVSALEKDGGADIKKEISDLQVAVAEAQVAVTTAQNDIDALETKVNSGHVYSTEEKVVSTWIDGKPIYERVIISDSLITLASNTWATIDNSSIYDTLISAFGITSNDNIVYPLIASGNTGELRVIQTRNANVNNLQKFIVQYTKTSDNSTN